MEKIQWNSINKKQNKLEQSKNEKSSPLTSIWQGITIGNFNWLLLENEFKFWQAPWGNYFLHYELTIEPPKKFTLKKLSYPLNLPYKLENNLIQIYNQKV